MSHKVGDNELQWKAIYNDGTFLPLKREDGTENKYTDIDRNRLIQFVLLNGDKPVITIHLDKNKKLIYRRRVYRDTGNILGVIYLVGWQENKNGVNVQSISFVFPDGHIHVLDRFYENHPIFDKINFREEEKI